MNDLQFLKALRACPCRLLTFSVVLSLLSFHIPAKAEEKAESRYLLAPVVITASHIPASPPVDTLSLSIITREEIEHLPVDTVSDLLEYVSGVDLQQRSVHGVQSDVSIRGSTFEQVLILVDGVNVNDAQTGHHNMDLPVNLEDIERIEVFKGPGARIYGQHAMAGAINIVTKDGAENAIGGHVTYGGYDYKGIGLHGSLNIGGLGNRASVSSRSSSGHIKNKTDFDIRTFSYKGSLRGERHSCRFGLGLAEKDFGAYGFYSDTYPDEREHTDTFLAYGSSHLQFERWEMVPTVFFRRHEDDFRINISNSWYQNRHTTETAGMHLYSRFRSRLGTTSFGGEAACDKLESSNLGDRERRRLSTFLEQSFSPFESLSVILGISAMKYGDWSWEYWPGAGFTLALTERIHWFSSFESSFRIPTYTELFYHDKANQGDPDLKREKARTYETGIRWEQGGFSAHASVFVRDSKDLIDWSRHDPNEPWRARNISQVTTRGLELSLNIFSTARIAYTCLDAHLDTGGLQSKYVLNQTRHQVHGSLMLNWPGDLRQAITARYEERMMGESHIILDTRFGYRYHGCYFFLEATNILDERYTEAGFAPMPGIWISGGVKFLLYP